MRTPDLMTKDPNMIRIMVQLFGVLTKASVAKIFKLIQDNIMMIANHKFGIYLIQKVIERDIDSINESETLNNQQTTSMLLKRILLGDQKKTKISDEKVSVCQNNADHGSDSDDYDKIEMKSGPDEVSTIKGTFVGCRMFIEEFILDNIEEFTSKKYLKYVLYRSVLGGQYSREFPENRNDTEEQAEEKKMRMKERNKEFCEKLVIKMLEKNEEGRRLFVDNKLIVQNDISYIFLLAIMDLKIEKVIKIMQKLPEVIIGLSTSLVQTNNCKKIKIFTIF